MFLGNEDGRLFLRFLPLLRVMTSDDSGPLTLESNFPINSELDSLEPITGLDGVPMLFESLTLEKAEVEFSVL